MSTPLDRRPLENFDGIEVGRQVKLGAAIPDARPLISAITPSVFEIEANGYRGTIDQLLTSTSRFAVTIPEGTRGIVLRWSSDCTSAAVAFIWKTPKSEKITAAVCWITAADLVNHRGAPPLPGEKAKTTAPTDPTTPAPAPVEPSSSMFQTLTATPLPPSMPLPEPTPLPSSIPAPAPGSLDAMLAAIVDARVGARVSALELELANRPAGVSVHHVRINDAAPVQLSKRPHVRLPHILARASMRKPDGGRFNVFMIGDAGTGKTTIAAHVAEALGLSFRSICCSGGLTEGALVGRLTPNLTTGELVYTPGPLVEAFRDGGVFLLDELDAADENVLLAINSMIDAPVWFAPNGQAIDRHTDFVLLGGGNTYGTGASRIFNGRTQLDGAFLNRWFNVPVDYDIELERTLCACLEIADRIQKARAIIRTRNLRRWLTTRDILKADALVGQLGVTVSDALREITEGWTDEDRAVLSF